jgi:hypothetical protein
MPQGRIILKSISESKKLASLKTDGARLLYTWLITHLDVNGCFSADPDVVNGKVFTRLNKSRKTVVAYMDDLENNQLIIRYETNGDIFLIVPDFVDKQPNLQPKKEGKPTIPRPTPDQLQSNSTTSKVKERKVKVSKDSLNPPIVPPKKQFLEFVRLSDEEHKKLIDRLGLNRTADYIDKLNNYIGSKGKKYKSHYHTILNWSNKDNERTTNDRNDHKRDGQYIR